MQILNWHHIKLLKNWQAEHPEATISLLIHTATGPGLNLICCLLLSEMGFWWCKSPTISWSLSVVLCALGIVWLLISKLYPVHSPQQTPLAHRAAPPALLLLPSPTHPQLHYNADNANPQLPIFSYSLSSPTFFSPSHTILSSTATSARSSSKSKAPRVQ